MASQTYCEDVSKPTCDHHRDGLVASELNVEYWKCEAHSPKIDTLSTEWKNLKLPEMKSGGKYTCSDHNSAAACSANKRNVYEEMDDVQSSCIGHSGKNVGVPGAIQLGNVAQGSQLLNYTVQTLYDNIKLTLAKRAQHPMYSSHAGDMAATQRPATNSIAKTAIISKLHEVMKAVDQDTKVVGSFPSNITAGKQANAVDMNSVINSSNSLINDCVCYSDCNGYSVCYCYGNCNHY